MGLYIIFCLGQENGGTFSNIAKHNGESYDLRTNYQSKATEVFQEPSKFFVYKINTIFYLRYIINSIIQYSFGFNYLKYN